MCNEDALLMWESILTSTCGGDGDIVIRWREFGHQHVKDTHAANTHPTPHHRCGLRAPNMTPPSAHGGSRLRLIYRIRSCNGLRWIP